MKRRSLLAAMLVLALALGGCAVSAQPLATPLPDLPLPDAPGTPLPSPEGTGKPAGEGEGQSTPAPGEEKKKSSALALPEKLERDEKGEPILNVYDVKDKKVSRLSIEAYLPGVLAGEMRGDWPMEALRAQAILARTFVLKFCEEKTSRYPGADISTDIEEAQAYDAAGVNERIREAVSSTRGEILNAQGELPYAWFHAHSGGITAKAKEGLDYEKPEPPYTKSVKGMEGGESDPDAAEWTASFPTANVMKAAQRLGVPGNQLKTIEVSQRGESGRAVQLLINGQSVSAPAFRLALGSTQMKSTLLESLKIENGQVKMRGRGYGHGVGMSQWGAYTLAQQGEKAEDIVTYYFQGVNVEKMW
jgi:stage II sporulation protein D